MTILQLIIWGCWSAVVLLFVACLIIEGVQAMWKTARDWTWRDTGSLILLFIILLIASIAYHGRL